MLHAAYSCLHFRSMLQDLDLDETISIPPMDVYIEVSASFIILMLSELIGSGKMQQVEVAVKSTSGPKRRPLQAPAYRTRDFDIYEHRGKKL